MRLKYSVASCVGAALPPDLNRNHNPNLNRLGHQLLLKVEGCWWGLRCLDKLDMTHALAGMGGNEDGLLDDRGLSKAPQSGALHTGCCATCGLWRVVRVQLFLSIFFIIVRVIIILIGLGSKLLQVAEGCWLGMRSLDFARDDKCGLCTALDDDESSLP